MGFGLGSLGAMPFGFSSPGAAPAPLPATESGVRLVDPMTGDLTRESSGAFTQAGQLLQRVLFLLRTEFRSSSVFPQDGLERPTKISETFLADTRSRVATALSPLGSDVTLISVTVSLATRPPLITVSYQDPNGNVEAVTV